MPLYEYECEACGKRFELIQKYSDGPPEACPKCGKGPVLRQQSSPAFHLKGSGWYITDYARKGASSSEGESSKGEGSKGEGSKGEGAKGEGSKSEGSKSESSKKTDASAASASGNAGSSDAKKSDSAPASTPASPAKTPSS